MENRFGNGMTCRFMARSVALAQHFMSQGIIEECHPVLKGGILREVPGIARISDRIIDFNIPMAYAILSGKQIS